MLSDSELKPESKSEFKPNVKKERFILKPEKKLLKKNLRKPKSSIPELNDFELMERLDYILSKLGDKQNIKRRKKILSAFKHMDIVNFLDNIETAAATDEQQKELDEFKEAALLKYRADNPDTAESEMALYEEELNYKARQILLKQFVLKSLSEYSTDVTFKVLSVGNNVVLQVDDTEKNYVIAIGKYSTYSEEAIEALSA